MQLNRHDFMRVVEMEHMKGYQPSFGAFYPTRAECGMYNMFGDHNSLPQHDGITCNIGSNSD